MKSLEEAINALDKPALAALTGHLLSFVSPARAERIDRTLADRTRFITVVLEDLYQTHNASAVVRSCECFGVQDIHVIEDSNAFEVNKRIVQGAAKWVTLHRYNGREGTRRCLEQLKHSGYRIAAMSVEPGVTPIEKLPLEAPLALCFGSEEPGLTQQARQMADTAATIPMHGFTPSLNLSVSTGIALSHLGDRLRRSDRDWHLETSHRERLRALWLARSIASGRRIVHRYLENAPR